MTHLSASKSPLAVDSGLVQVLEGIRRTGGFVEGLAAGPGARLAQLVSRLVRRAGRRVLAGVNRN